MENSVSRLNIGQLMMTAGIAAKMGESNGFKKKIMGCINRYINKDWGNLCREDKELNDQAVASGNDRIVAKYRISGEDPVYIITEWDHSYTTVLFCHEY